MVYTVQMDLYIDDDELYPDEDIKNFIYNEQRKKFIIIFRILQSTFVLQYLFLSIKRTNVYPSFSSQVKCIGIIAGKGAVFLDAFPVLFAYVPFLFLSFAPIFSY